MQKCQNISHFSTFELCSLELFLIKHSLVISFSLKLDVWRWFSFKIAVWWNASLCEFSSLGASPVWGFVTLSRLLTDGSLLVSSSQLCLYLRLYQSVEVQLTNSAAPRRLFRAHHRWQPLSLGCVPPGWTAAGLPVVVSFLFGGWFRAGLLRLVEQEPLKLQRLRLELKLLWQRTGSAASMRANRSFHGHFSSPPRCKWTSSRFNRTSFLRCVFCFCFSSPSISVLLLLCLKRSWVARGSLLNFPWVAIRFLWWCRVMQFSPRLSSSPLPSASFTCRTGEPRKLLLSLFCLRS